MPSFFARFAIVLAAAAPFAACHAAHAESSAKAVTPTVDIEIEDRGPDRAAHVARFSVVALDGKAEVFARDGESKYEIAAYTTSADPNVKVALKRGGADRFSELDVKSSVPQREGRVVVARVDRADGRVTTVIAQVR